jgi:hypothetical protein
MSNARFWFVPLKDIAPAQQQALLAAKEDVRASDLPASFNVPSKLHQEGIRAAHLQALCVRARSTAIERGLGRGLRRAASNPRAEQTLNLS